MQTTSDESRPSYISGRASNVPYGTEITGTGTVHCNPFRLNFSANFGIFTAMGLNGTIIEAEIHTFKCLERLF